MVSPDVKRNLLLILKESVNNVMKHAAATRVTVTLQASPEAIVLEIRDNGKGFNAGIAHPNGNGIKNMNKRAAAVQGTLTVDSTAEQGTCIRLSVRLRSE